MKKILFILFIALTVFANADVLMWSVNGDANVYDSKENHERIDPLYAFVVPYEESDGMNACARVKVVSGGISESIILPIYMGNGQWNKDIDPEMVEWGTEIGENGSGYWGAYFNQSLIPSEATLETLFQIEIGHGVDEWETVAWSDWFTKSDLSKEGYTPGDISPPGYSWGGWMPAEFYTIQPAIPSSPSVPEPTAGLLLLLGIGFLGLRRKPVGV